MNRIALAGLLTLVVGISAEAGEVFHGVVLDGAGSPVAGALVSAHDRGLERVTTVYSDSEGRFAIPELAEGAYDLRARRHPYKDGHVLGVAARAEPFEIGVQFEEDPWDRFGNIPSNRWFALLLAEMPNARTREEFVRQCTYCHQQGNWATRVERTPEEWDKIFSLMARMGGILSPETREVMPALINRAYEPEGAFLKLAAQLEAEPLPNPAGLDVVIDEWSVGDRASVQHDIVVDPDGRVWSVDTTKDALYRLDPKTGERRIFPIPSAGLPIGGLFTGQVLPPNTTARVAPHSLQVAPDGTLWITLCIGNKIGVFDPEKESWELIDLPDGLYPHTIRFDQKGRAWYTLAVSNHVGMIDPATREPIVIRLPTRTWAQAIGTRLMPIVLAFSDWFTPPETISPDALPPVPYGIDVAPDGGIWFSQLNSERIGRIDPETHDIEMYDTPFPGPRRLRFDSKGNIWVPGFSAGVIMRFDPRTKKFSSWTIPIYPLGTETPYALNVDRRTDHVWICGTNSDTLIRFEPESEKFTTFPLPTRVTYTREIDFDEDGNVWTSNSNTPGWHVETEKPQILRLRFKGGEAAPQRTARAAAHSDAPRAPR